MNCNLKAGYPSRARAWQIIRDRVDNDGMSDRGMHPFWCRKHHAWHIGHSYKRGRRKEKR